MSVVPFHGDHTPSVGRHRGCGAGTRADCPGWPADPGAALAGGARPALLRGAVGRRGTAVPQPRRGRLSLSPGAGRGLTRRGRDAGAGAAAAGRHRAARPAGGHRRRPAGRAGAITGGDSLARFSAAGTGVGRPARLTGLDAVGRWQREGRRRGVPAPWPRTLSLGVGPAVGRDFATCLVAPRIPSLVAWFP